MSIKEMKPPKIEVGYLGWLKNNLFNSPFNTFLTLIILYFCFKAIPSLLSWFFLKSVWFSDSSVCHASSGACWSYIPANIRFILFGFFPSDEHWRPASSLIIVFIAIFYSKEKQNWQKSLIYVWLAVIIISSILMHGGIFGLSVVESRKWSGLPLTIMLSVFGMAFAYPLGIILALGRRSNMPIIKTFCIVYIEIVRGVPLISFLFMSSVMFPLFLPEGITINTIFRAQIAIILFTAAYIAEVVRGGLQAIERGQYEAAESMGLNYYQKMRLIILPQALKIVIPPTVGILISAFKDTSLVAIIALYDLLRTTQSTLSDPRWMPFSSEAYIFVSFIYFIFCYTMSRYSRKLEVELNPGDNTK